jgi:uncharacterized protein (TIGR00297 family)
LQSRLLVLVVIPVLCWLAWKGVQYGISAGPAGARYLGMSAAVSVSFGLAARMMRAATLAAASCGVVICFNITVLSGKPAAGSVVQSGLPCLLVLFVLTHLATRYRREQKVQHDSEAEKHGRNAAQVIANLGIGAIAALQYCWVFRSVSVPPNSGADFAALQVPMLSALAEATADTVSSEIGQALGGRPFLLITLRRVAPGTDGAVSVVGTVAGIASAVMIALTGAAAVGIHSRSVYEVVIAATAGLFFDSLLGATAERRGWIGNDAVNFGSTWFAAIIGWLLQRAMFA